MSVRVIFNKAKVKARIVAASERATVIIANEFLKDANYYARQDTGNLIRSAELSSIPEKGIVQWVTPYARRVYYFGSPSKLKNVNARLRWAEIAKSENMEKYRRMGAQIIRQKV